MAKIRLRPDFSKLILARMKNTLFPTRIAIVKTVSGTHMLRVPAETNEEALSRIKKRGDCEFVRWGRADEPRPDILNKLISYDDVKSRFYG